MKKNDILYCEWGYEQTNIDFYKVIDVSKSGKTVTVIELESKKDYTGDMTGETMPVDTVKEGAREIKRRVKAGYNGEYIDVSSFEFARLWNGKPMYFTQYA